MATIRTDKCLAHTVSGFQNGNTITVPIKGTAFMEGRAYKYFLAYLEEYSLCKTARDKMLAIDRLLHYLHEDIDEERSVTPAAMNLVEGKRNDIREFIESLAYSGNMPEQNRRLRNELFRKMDKSTEPESKPPK